MTSPTDSSDENWKPRDWEPTTWEPDAPASSPSASDEIAGVTVGSGDDQPDFETGTEAASPWSEGSGLGDSSSDSTGGGDDYAPYAGSGGYEEPPPATSDPSSASDPYGQASAGDPYGQVSAPPPSQPSAPPYGQPSAPPYGQPSATPYGQPSAPPYGQPSATPYGQPSAAPQDPPPAENFPAYQATPGPQGYGQSGGGYGRNPYATSGYGTVAPYGAAAPVTNHPRAVPAMVCGIVGVVMCCLPVGIVGLVLGIGARKDITENPGRWTGSGMAMAGIILGAIGVGFSAIYYVITIVGALLN